ncbi:DUF4251 domain-containing protein [Aureibaculum sp. A20]|uniref:DUF4251 domain-containing protein n=1 Tax=Aureibaculum flavum TaxID=2795986 RepID=A0ABS0WRW0_9FLAO|nr:DUF4251 domain-containing protein [Aureibaculum flavum]MBJ2174697.1 DUF4251 domain-containing protein [Aureibaculum flavum]
MKKNTLLFYCLMLVLSTTMLTAQSKKELKKQKKLAEYAKTKMLVQNGQFVFKTSYIVTQKGDRTEAIGDGLLIEDDKAYANFPFIGNMNRGTLKGSNNIEFNTSETDFDIEYNDKRRKIFVKFEAKDKNESYTIYITILGTGKATVQISSSSRGIMSYEGEIQKVVI